MSINNISAYNYYPSITKLSEETKISGIGVENTSEDVKSESETVLQQMKQEFERINKQAARSSIETKLKSGNELSPREMKYLQSQEPDLYEVAVEVKRERDTYKKVLKNCKTRVDVKALFNRKISEFLSESKTIRQTPNLTEKTKETLLVKVNAKNISILKEHLKFVKSDEYKKLPETDENKKLRLKQRKPRLKDDDIYILGMDLPSDIKAVQEYVMEVLNKNRDARSQAVFADNPNYSDLKKGGIIDSIL